MTDITDINDARQKKKDKEERPRYTLTDLMVEFHSIMTRSGLTVPKPGQRWPHRTMVDSGSKDIMYLDETTGVCRRVEEARVRADFRSWVVESAPNHVRHWMNVSNRTLKECMEKFSHTPSVQVRPVAVKIGMDNDPCWSRIAIDPYSNPTPDGDQSIENFEAFTSRCGENATVIKQWIGSLFDEKSDRSQYLWIYGEGNDGKSTFIRWLHRVFGESFVSSMATDHSSEYWIDYIVGKRVVAFPDTNTYEFVTSQVFKTCSGSDPVCARAIYGKPYKAQLDCKFLFCSNKIPNISSANADLRRMIFVSLEGFEGRPDPSYEDRIAAEIPAIVSNCVGHYARFVAESGGHGKLVVGNQEEIDSLAEENESEITAELERFVEIEPKASVERYYMTKVEMHTIESVAFRGDKKKVRQSRLYLRQRGVLYRQVRFGERKEDGRKRMWVGVTLTDLGKKIFERYCGGKPRDNQIEPDLVAQFVTQREW